MYYSKLKGATVGVFAALTLALSVPTSHAHIPKHKCGKTVDIVKFITRQQKQKPLVEGDRGPNTAIMRLYVSDTGTFTVLLVQAGEQSCIVASGANFRKYIEGDDA